MGTTHEAMGKREGDIALITGSTSGIGFAAAKECVEEGAHVFITARGEAQVAAAVMESIYRRDDAAAYERAKEALRQTKGDPAREPEALYFESVAAYKVSHDPARLKEGWERLMERFPESD
jgi:NAD(P)-dependent dehydrogenase (short-subunit alcohol dehydrogenase family)